jgi:hypothetical protein
MSIVRFYALSLSVALLTLCSNPGGTSDETAFSTAKIFTPDYKPAKLAKVGFFAVSDTSPTPKQQIYTDNDGVYSVKNIANGEYNIVARQDSFICYQDSILIADGKALLFNDTLESGCAFDGKIILQSGQDPRNAVVHILGTPFYTNVDTAGRFTISGMPVGTYNFMVSVANLAGYVPTFVTESIDCGNSSTLNDTIAVIFTGIPMVNGLLLNYDTAAAVVHLSWKATTYREFRQYIISRYPLGQVNPVSDTTWATPDTFISDTFYFQPVPPKIFDSVYGYDAAAFTCEQKKYEYRVSIQNKSLETGSTYESSFLTADHPQAKDHPFRRHGLVAYVKQPCTLRVAPCIAYGATPAYAWDIGGTGTFVAGAGATYPFTVPDTFAIDYPCIVRITAQSGTVYYDSLHVKPEHRWVKMGSSGMGAARQLKIMECNGALYSLTKDQNLSLSLWKSSDALAWKKINDSLPRDLLDVISYHGELWALVDTMTLLHGVDGINWQTIDEQVFLRKTPELRNYQIVLYGDGQHLAVVNDTLYAFFCTAAQASFFAQIQPDTSLKIITPTKPMYGQFIQWSAVRSDSILFRTLGFPILFKHLGKTADFMNFEMEAVGYGDTVKTADEFNWISSAVVFRDQIIGFHRYDICCETERTLGRGYRLVDGLTKWENISLPPADRSASIDCFDIVFKGNLYSVGADIYRFE